MTTAHTIHLPNGMTVLQPNEVQQGKGFHVSYNDYDTSIYGDATTALVMGQGQHFYILNGDHREQYAPLIEKGLDACLDYFEQNSTNANKYSEKGKSRSELHAIVSKYIAWCIQKGYKTF